MSNAESTNVVDLTTRGVRGGSISPLMITLRGRSIGVLERVLAAVFDNADDTLFDMLNNVPPSDHQDYMDAMCELRLHRADSIKVFREHFEEVFRLTLHGDPITAEDMRLEATPASELSLLSEADLLQQLGATQIGQAILRDYAPVLSQLNRRMSAVIGGIELTDDSNPISGGHIGEAFSRAMAGCTIALSVKMILFKLFEREALDKLHEMYGNANKVLIDAGVLPTLGAAAVRSPDAARRHRRSSGQRTDQREQDSQDDNANESNDRGGSHASPVALSDDEHALFSNLHHLLQSYRGQSQQQPAAVQHGESPRRDMSSQEVLAILSTFQSEVPESVRGAIDDPSVSLAQRLKQEMMDGAGRLGIDPKSTAMSSNDEDAVDLVGMLFEVLLDERDLNGDIRSTIGRLVVPFIKVAMIDKRMFLQRSHPARKLLNSLAEACEGNKGETPQERLLLDKVNEVVDRLLSEFNENVAIFETLEQEFKAFIEQHRKRVELAERRAAEAQRGRERLEHARNIANAEIAVRASRYEMPKTMQSVLERYWNHHLTVTALRQGHESPEYREAVAAGDQVIESLVAARNGEAALLPTLAPMRQSLETILASSGCVGDAAKGVVRAIAEELRRLIRGENTDSVAEVVTANEPPPVAPPVAQTPDPNDVKLGLSADPEELEFEADDAERIRGMAVGTWIELRDESGESQPAKLSWISPISSRLLFVNRRGMRCCVASPEELAAMLRAGRMSIRDSSTGTAFEYAMNQVLGKLRGGDAPKPVAGS